MYAQGNGDTKNDAKAILWAREAAAQGNADAKQLLDRLGQPSEIISNTDSAPVVTDDNTTSAEGPADFLPLRVGTVLRYTMGHGIEFVDRGVDSSKGYGSQDIFILRKMSPLDLESARMYRADEDLKKLVIRRTSNALGETNCVVEPEVILEFPLKARKTWETPECNALGEEATEMVNAKTGTHREADKRYTQIKSVVEGRKVVKVPAGTFDTWVVRTKKSGPYETEDFKFIWSYYAKGVGLVLEEYQEKGKAKRARSAELVSIEGQ